MISPQCVIRRKTQPENLIEPIICRLCLDVISYTNSEITEEDITEAIEIVLLNLNLEKKHKYQMCKACSSKLFAAFNFKSTCMDTEDIISPHINISNVSVVELKEVYLKVNGNIQLTDMWENQKICRLCFQLITDGFVSLNKVHSHIIETYIPQVNINATKNPVICESCFNSLTTHGGFVRSCHKAHEKYKSDDKQTYINSEETEIKLEVGDDIQDKYKSHDKQLYIKSEEIDVKTEDGDQDSNFSYTLDEDTNRSYEQEFYIKSEEIEIKTEERVQCSDNSSCNLDKKSIENREKYIYDDITETKYEYMDPLGESSYKNRIEDDLKQKIVEKRKFSSEMHKYDMCDYETKHNSNLKRQQIAMYRCDTCDYEAKYKSVLKSHQLLHKDPSEIQMYKCDACDYEAKWKDDMKNHQLTHKDCSEIQIYRCDTCNFETKYKGDLKRHQITHKDPSETEMYKCDICTYETKYKKYLKSHQLLHKNPSQIQMYKCDFCPYQAKYNCSLRRHQLIHKDSSEVEMYKCDFCSYETKYRSCLRRHQLIHRDPSKIQKYKCDACDYECKRKSHLKSHQLRHKDCSEIKITEMRPWNNQDTNQI